ncbi:hypothetical protein JNUCC1_00602 [Lentibacillus sp. JNUCC-1]|uniref:hypothetical protein n=1 Tax=Lentibacillus sp. JNUCC-1 TaxID=2654513 RepID=UPI0012E8A22A|nr:hypothetical protein [Lentibacillus sp. JNUCC-1]MUV36798.1 hypothetical protein [Lentibacillus sp. JNUCC-1]
MFMNQYEKKYAARHASLGASFGVLTLLARWVGPDTIFFSSEILMRYGLLGIIIYTLFHAAAFVMFGWVAHSAKTKWPESLTLGDIIERKTEGVQSNILIALVAVSGLLMLAIQGFIIHHMLSILFVIPVPITLFIFMLFCYLYGGVWGMQGILKLEPFKLAIIFAAIIFIPVYVFIQQGIEPIYNGLRLYHPYLLYWKDYSSLSFLFSSFLLVFGLIMIDRTSWQRTFMLQHSKVRSTFSLMGLIYSTIPLAILSMLMISLSNQGYEQAGDVLFELIYKLSTSFILALFVTFCIIIATSTVGAELNALTILIVRHLSPAKYKSDAVKYQYSYIISACIALGVYIAGLFSTHAIVPLIFFNGMIGAVMIVPVFIIIYGKKSIKSLEIISMFFALGIGVMFFFSGNYINAIWISFSASALLTLLTYTMNMNSSNSIS